MFMYRRAREATALNFLVFCKKEDEEQKGNEEEDSFLFKIRK